LFLKIYSCIWLSQKFLYYNSIQFILYDNIFIIIIILFVKKFTDVYLNILRISIYKCYEIFNFSRKVRNENRNSEYNAVYEADAIIISCSTCIFPFSISQIRAQTSKVPTKRSLSEAENLDVLLVRLNKTLIKAYQTSSPQIALQSTRRTLT
jgi:hypothetical protein